MSNAVFIAKLSSRLVRHGCPIALRLLILLAALGLSPALLASEGLKPGDSIWEVSTRHLPKCIPATCQSEFNVHEFEGCSWNASSEQTLFDRSLTQPARTVIYIHGNWMEWCNARQRALAVYSAIACRSSEPIRFIAFSWPSEQRERPARDLLTKKPLISASSFYLSMFINRLSLAGQMTDQQPLSVLGYSFGGAVACGSLHLLAGGALDGHCLCEPPQPILPIRVSLMAPAFDQRDLSRCGKYSLALGQTDFLVNLYNSRDPILRHFRFIDSRTEPIAAGFAGLVQSRANEPLDANEKIRQYDCQSVGRSHDELNYYRCPGLSRSIDNLLGR